MTIDSADVSPGDTFTINVTVDPEGDEVYGAQYNLAFNPAILRFVEQTKGDFLSPVGSTTTLNIQVATLTDQPLTATGFPAVSGTKASVSFQKAM